jgi:hypothetical protein
LVRHPLSWRNRNSKKKIKIMLIIFFDYRGVVHKEFVPEGKTVNAIFYKGVMDRLLKRIERVRAAAFCSRDFFLLHNNAPVHKCSFANFWPKKMLQPSITPHTLQIYLHQSIFCSPCWKLSYRDPTLWMLLRSKKP